MSTIRRAMWEPPATGAASSFVKQDHPKELVGVVHYGLGPIGLAVARVVGQRAGLRSIAAIDKDPRLVGQSLAALLGTSKDGLPTVQSGLGAAYGGNDVALHCTGSRLEDVLPQLHECIEAGLDVISTCEELAYPWVESRALSDEIDTAARRHNVTVLGTGINPGFAMDYLPLVLTAVSGRVDHVLVERRLDANARRMPLQRKIGAGLTTERFSESVRQGLLGHIGLLQSAQALAGALGWSLTKIDESIEPLVAEVITPSALGDIVPGKVTGLRHRVVGFIGEREVLTLDLQMAIGLGASSDEISISGDPDVRLRVPGGLHGDSATAAIVVNSVPRVRAAGAGLIVMSDLAPPRPG
jgi:2,4-diaminopentanoate dehydrogenase